MVQFLEMTMLILFGLSWPFNIAKSLRSRTAKGKSLLFECFVIVGYFCGLLGKLIGGQVNYVAFMYFLDMLMVSIDLGLGIRNRHLDRLAEKEESV